jgi:hypothetical protein
MPLLQALASSIHMLSVGAAMRETAIEHARLAHEEAQRIGVYMLAGVVGLLVTGVIACANELRRDMADRKLRNAQNLQAAAGAALQALARTMNARSA